MLAGKVLQLRLEVALEAQFAIPVEHEVQLLELPIYLIEVLEEAGLVRQQVELVCEREFLLEVLERFRRCLALDKADSVQFGVRSQHLLELEHLLLEALGV